MVVDQRQSGLRFEGRVDLFLSVRQRQPGLHAVDPPGQIALGRQPAFGVDDAAPGGHQVDLAGADRGKAAQTVAVVDCSCEQPGDRGDPDMRMRAHIHAGSGGQVSRAELIDENERSHHHPARIGQDPADLKGPQIVGGGQQGLHNRIGHASDSALTSSSSSSSG